MHERIREGPGSLDIRIPTGPRSQESEFKGDEPRSLWEPSPALVDAPVIRFAELGEIQADLTKTHDDVLIVKHPCVGRQGSLSCLLCFRKPTVTPMDEAEGAPSCPRLLIKEDRRS